MPCICAANVDSHENTPWKIRHAAKTRPAGRDREPHDCVALQFHPFFQLKHQAEVDLPGLLMRPFVIPNGSEMGVVSKGGGKRLMEKFLHLKISPAHPSFRILDGCVNLGHCSTHGVQARGVLGGLLLFFHLTRTNGRG